MATENQGGASGTTNTDAGASAVGITSLSGEPGTTGTPPAGGENTDQNKGNVGNEGDKTGQQDGDKGSDQNAKPPVVPDKYELKLPEGVLVDDKVMEKFTALGKELKWDNATAQKMADLHLEAVGQFAQKADAEFEQQVTQWSKEIAEDKEIGGAKLEETMTQARKVVALASTIPGLDAKRLVSDLTRTGLTTHPDMVRLFHYFGQFLGEDNKFINGSPANLGPKDAATILYGAEGVKK